MDWIDLAQTTDRVKRINEPSVSMKGWEVLA
jgi:hypothetical protein